MPHSQKVSDKATRTKQKIFHAGMELFRKQGFYHTTVEEIVAAAGVSIGSFYYHYKSKEALFMDWADGLDENCGAFFQRLKARRGDKNALELLHELLLYTVSVFADCGKEFCMLLYMQLQQTAEFYNRMYTPGCIHNRILFELITEGKETGCIRKDISTEQLVQNIHKIKRGVCVDWCISADQDDVVEASRSLIDMMIQAMCASAEQSRAEK